MYFKNKLSYIEILTPEIQEKILDIYNSIFILTIGEDEEVDAKLSCDLGELAFLIMREDISYATRINICSNIFSVFERSNEPIKIKLKNFFEMLCTTDELVLNWLANIQKSNKPENVKNAEILSEIITASRIKRGDIEICEREIEFMTNNSRAYRELSIYHLFSGNFIKSLYYINRALKNCPESLRKQLELKRREIIYRMEE